VGLIEHYVVRPMVVHNSEGVGEPLAMHGLQILLFSIMERELFTQNYREVHNTT